MKNLNSLKFKEMLKYCIISENEKEIWEMRFKIGVKPSFELTLKVCKNLDYLKFN